ncbi:MAG: C45 family autoproteolytic acyltransferase/hydrolase [Acidobacteriota bacterium]|nr:C45 family autoproteolytic acyltransferase/hydrolase [Acidobacteriota bacterium]
MTTEKLPLIKLSGSPREIGLKHGTLLRDRIRATFNFYTETLNPNSSFDFESHGNAYLEAIREDTPAYAEEIEAIAEGAGMAPWQITVINARTEIFLRLNSEFFAGECTALFFKDVGLLGQTWDWMDRLEDLMVLLDVTRQDGHRFLTMVEPGMIGKIGLNSAGLGVALNILPGEPGKIAVPVHVMLRKVLDASSLDEVRMTLSQTTFASCFSNFMIGNELGEWCNLELDDKEIINVFFRGCPLHTNHYLGREINENIAQIPDSPERLKRAGELLKEVPVQSLDAMKRILDDRQGENNAINKRFFSVGPALVGTLCTIIMDLPNRTMHITKGNPRHNGFATYAVSA